MVYLEVKPFSCYYVHRLNTIETTDSELAILETIYLAEKSKKSIKQRELASAASLSLGMTNAIIRRFVEKGWLSVRHLNPRNIQYAVTPEGVREITRRAYGYFKRTINNVIVYKDFLENLVADKRKEGYTGILLLGPSDFEFIVDYACQKNDLFFMKTAEVSSSKMKNLSGRYLHIFSENVPFPESGDTAPDALYLMDVFTRA